MAPAMKRVYLLGYNFAQALGWGVIAFALVAATTTLGGDVQATRVLRAVTLLQLAQLMEVAHAAIGTHTHTRQRRIRMKCISAASSVFLRYMYTWWSTGKGTDY